VPKNKVVLVTGCAGFIGFHLTLRLLDEGFTVIGLDNLNDYYEPKLKQDRLSTILKKIEYFSFYQVSLEDQDMINLIFTHHPISIVVHLAAQAGVRYSLENPRSYLDSNIIGFGNILEACRNHPVEHLLYASSSSVYGANKKIPFSVHDHVDHPVSLYAATKRANELMAHTYSHLFSLPTTGLRFFTVYGPWGRPDMAYFIFTKAILSGKPIKIFNHGEMRRDFTYIDDAVEAVFRLIQNKPEPNPIGTGINPDPASSNSPFRIYNIGNNCPIGLLDFISVLEDELGQKAIKNLLSMEPGDVPETYADIKDLIDDVGFQPVTPIEEGISKFVSWYQDYYRVLEMGEI